MKTAKERVLEVWPNAVCVDRSLLMYAYGFKYAIKVLIDGAVIGLADTEQDAWENAAKTIGV